MTVIVPKGIQGIMTVKAWQQAHQAGLPFRKQNGHISCIRWKQVTGSGACV